VDGPGCSDFKDFVYSQLSFAEQVGEERVNDLVAVDGDGFPLTIEVDMLGLGGTQVRLLDLVDDWDRSTGEPPACRYRIDVVWVHVGGE